uniref:Zinc finger protein n=1 Tax=Caenorhabditis tropicalis TaxID=1561998 RepID=A0A1I7THT9_9PELO
MSGSDHGMNSEKEETEVIKTEDQTEDAIPGSSPEGVFPNEESHLFDSIDQDEDVAPNHIPLQVDDLKHGEEIVEQEAEVLNHDDLLVEEGQQYMNMVQISQEDVYEAGFDIEDLNLLTEEQLNIVISISQQRQAKQNELHQNEEGQAEDGSHHHMIHHEMIDNHFEGEPGEHHYGGDDDRPPLGDNSVQIILTNDGGVSITDTKQQHYYISPDIIANLNIDLNALSNEHVNQLLQLAIPSLKDGSEKNDDGNSYSREHLNSVPSTSYHHHQNEVESEKSSRNPVIGETVQIRTPDGRLQDAVVKYVRGGTEYKIQFMNGDFAYATLDQMNVPLRNRSDHGNYQNASPMLLRRADVAHLTGQKRVASSSEDLCPPLLKRSYHLAPVVDGPHVMHTPNFCCPICDKKVFQKEPSYIVIRLPACDSCTREKL